jgi:hypothetical protein
MEIGCVMCEVQADGKEAVVDFNVTLEHVCSIQGPTRCTFLCILYSSLFLAVHVSGAVCTHPQEHNCSVQRVYGFGMLVYWSSYWLGHPHTFSTVIFTF